MVSTDEGCCMVAETFGLSIAVGVSEENNNRLLLQICCLATATFRVYNRDTVGNRKQQGTYLSTGCS